MLPEMDWLTLGCCRGVLDLFEVFVGLVNDVVAGCYFGIDFGGDVMCAPEISIFTEIQKEPVVVVSCVGNLLKFLFMLHFDLEEKQTC